VAEETQVLQERVCTPPPLVAEENQVLHGRVRTLCVAAAVLVVAFSVFLRFYTTSKLWLDEALTVDRSSLPLGSIAGSLKQDGAPPLYYYLLHFWMELFGQSAFATRSLSGVIGVATLPVAWLAGKRLGGRPVAWVTLLLVATAPFAVFYATSARMYALAILLTGCGFLSLSRALVKPTPGNLIATGVVTAALLYTQYWSLYLVAVVVVWLLGGAWWRWHQEQQSGSRPGAWRRFLPPFYAVAVGCLLFIPWLPTFLYQSKHTGTPWAAPPTFVALLNTPTSFALNQGSLDMGGTIQGRLLALAYIALFLLALFGVAKSKRFIEIDLRTRPRARSLSIVVVGTLVAAFLGGLISSSAFSPRYAGVVFLPFVLVVALGTTTLLSAPIRAAVIGVAVLAGAVVSVQNVYTQRTQATQVAAVINQHAQPGDVIAFCPDQLGPAVYRLTSARGRYDMVTYPRGTSPEFVDWVDYKTTVQGTSVSGFATKLVADSQKDSPHRIWLVWEPGYATFGTRCETLVNTLLENPQYHGRQWVISDGNRYYEPMQLTEYAPTSK
jgi:mannosyltransferase